MPPRSRRAPPRPYSVVYRPAAAGPETPWLLVASAGIVAEARDELESWRGPHLHHGDLVRVVGSKKPLDFLFDSNVGRFRAWPDLISSRPEIRAMSWLDLWEGDDGARDRAVRMMELCKYVALPRAVLAACACAKEVVWYAWYHSDLTTRAIVQAHMLARGEGGSGLSATDAELLAEIQHVDRHSAVAYALSAVRDAARLALYGAGAGHDRRRAVECAEHAEQAIWMYATATVPADSRPGWIDQKQRGLVEALRRHVPLSAVMCSWANMADPLPLRGEL